MYKAGRNRGKKTDNLTGEQVVVKVPLICRCLCGSVMLICVMGLFCLDFIMDVGDELQFSPGALPSLDPILKTNFSR